MSLFLRGDSAVEYAGADRSTASIISWLWEALPSSGKSDSKSGAAFYSQKVANAGGEEVVKIDLTAYKEAMVPLPPLSL